MHLLEGVKERFLPHTVTLQLLHINRIQIENVYCLALLWLLCTSAAAAATTTTTSNQCQILQRRKFYFWMQICNNFLPSWLNPIWREEEEEEGGLLLNILFCYWILAIKVEQNFWLKGLIKTNQPYLQTIKFSANLSYFILKPDFTVNQPRSELGDNMAQVSWCNWYRNSYTNVNAFTTGPNPTNNVTKWCY